MYSQEAIDVLKNRIGWSGLPFGPAIAIDEDNLTTESGVTFDWYSAMVLPEMIYYAVSEKNMSETDFNTYLQNVKISAVKSVLKEVFDRHLKYDNVKDYSSDIISKSLLFDDAIGYTVAVKMIELFITTTRSNFTERNAKMSYQTLKIELEGAKNENGHFIAKGLGYKLSQSIKDIQKIFFPIEIIGITDSIQ